MKILVSQNIKAIITNLMVSFLLWFCISISARANEISGPQDSIIIKKCVSNKNQDTRLYPGTSNEKLYFAVMGNNGKNYQLFVFDMDSKLVKQTPVINKQKNVQVIIEKGHYLFEVFSNDERIENGSIVIK